MYLIFSLKKRGGWGELSFYFTVSLGIRNIWEKWAEFNLLVTLTLTAYPVLHLKIVKFYLHTQIDVRINNVDNFFCLAVYKTKITIWWLTFFNDELHFCRQMDQFSLLIYNNLEGKIFIKTHAFENCNV